MALLSSLSIGQKIKIPVKPASQAYFGDYLRFVVVDKNHTGYPANSVTLATEYIEKIMCYDAPEPQNPSGDISTRGNSNYYLSNRLRWLNSNASLNWYYQSHTYDAAPSSGNYAFSNNPGFLASLDASYYNILLDTTIPYNYNIATNRYSSTFLAKVFELSAAELGGLAFGGEGSEISYFSNQANRIKYPSQQCVNNFSPYWSGLSTSSPLSWFTRSPENLFDSFFSLSKVRFVTSLGEITYEKNNNAYASNAMGIIFAVNISGDQYVLDDPDANGYYSIAFNAAPSIPGSITVPSSVYATQNVNISWEASTDPEEDSISYRLERSVNGGSYSQIASTASTSFVDTSQISWTSVYYRVKAVDSGSNSSGYATSSEMTVSINYPPTISGTDSNLGIKADEFSIIYSVDDIDDTSVNVTEAIDGNTIRTYSATLEAENTFSVSGTNWLRLLNGQHNLTITAVDAFGNQTVRTHQFVKSVDSFSVELGTPLPSEEMPVRISLTVTRNLPPEATFLVEVCNNAYDETPTWENATSAVTGELAYVFENDAKTDANWGVSVKVSVSRNGGAGSCYISFIGGNFE